MQVEVPNVPDQQCEQLVALLGGPALPRASFADRAFHDVPTGRTTARNGTPKTLGPGVVEAQQFHELDELLSPALVIAPSM